jgi:hypothetical protein
MRDGLKAEIGMGIDHGFHGWARMGPGAETETAERGSIRVLREKEIWLAKGEFVNRAGYPQILALVAGGKESGVPPLWGDFTVSTTAQNPRPNRTKYS